jgi:hypothetical protein
VKGYAASVENVRVNVKGSGWESEYIDGADRKTVTFGVFGRELRVSKTIVSLPSTASQGMGGLGGVGMSDAVIESLGSASRAFKASLALAGQCGIEVVGLKYILYFLSGWSAEVMNGSSSDCRFWDVVNWV